MSDFRKMNIGDVLYKALATNDASGDGVNPNGGPHVALYDLATASQTKVLSASAAPIGGAGVGVHYVAITCTANLVSAGGYYVLAASASVSGANPAAVLCEVVFNGGVALSAELASANTIQLAVKASVSSIHTDTGNTLDGKLDDIAGATFDTNTDSLEAIRNRGDAAWTGDPTYVLNGTAVEGGAGQIVLATASCTLVDDYYNGCLVFVHTGTGAGQSRYITAFGAETTASTEPPWTVAPDNTSQYYLYPAQIESIDVPTTSDITNAVWDSSTTGHTNAGTFGQQLKTDVDAILADTADMQPKLGTDSSTVFSAIRAIDSLTSATASAIVAGALADYGAVTSAVVSAVGVNVLTNYGVPTSANMSAMMSAVGSAVAKNAADDYDALILSDLRGSEPTNVTSASSNIVKKIDMIHALAVNKITQTSTTFTLRTSADDGNIATAAVSDDGTTFTRGKVS